MYVNQICALTFKYPTFILFIFVLTYIPSFWPKQLNHLIWSSPDQCLMMSTDFFAVYYSKFFCFNYQKQYDNIFLSFCSMDWLLYSQHHLMHPWLQCDQWDFLTSFFARRAPFHFLQCFEKLPQSQKWFGMCQEGLLFWKKQAIISLRHKELVAMFFGSSQWTFIYSYFQLNRETDYCLATQAHKINIMRPMIIMKPLTVVDNRKGCVISYSH